MTRTRLACALIGVLLASSGPVLAQTGWEPVVGPTAAVPAGFGDGANRYAEASAVFDGQLYVGTINTATGCEIWRTADGDSWSQVSLDGFGDADNQGVHSMAVFEGRLYAATDLLNVPGATRSAGTRIWRTADGITWTMVKDLSAEDYNLVEPHSMVVWGGDLWVGVGNYVTGTEIWRSSNGTSWFQHNTDGFGTSSNQYTAAMAAGGYLWAVTHNPASGCEVWRFTGGITGWSQASSGGFGDSDNIGSWAMAALDDAIYVATVNLASGMEVWRYADGWTRVVAGGFGASLASHAMLTASGTLYLGTRPTDNQTEIWSTHDGLSWTQLSAPGFGVAGNWATGSLAALGGHIYAGASNTAGLQVWRGPEPVFADSFEAGSTSAWSAAGP